MGEPNVTSNSSVTSRVSLTSPVSSLPGWGRQRSESLTRLKIHTVADLLHHRPRRYEDRRACARIADLEAGQSVTVQATVEVCGVKYARQRTKSVFELIADDGSARLHCRWWNMPFLERYFRPGETLFIHGQVRSLRPRTMDHPETERVEEGEESIHLRRIVPIYPLTEGLAQRPLRRSIASLLAQLGGDWHDPWQGLVPVEFPSYSDALRWIHFPEEWADIERARQRLALHEWLDLQSEIARRRARLAERFQGNTLVSDNRWIRPFLKELGFKLTGEQAGVLREIRADLNSTTPMRRLLQGDVGAGKTVVAACAMLMALEAGSNAVLMAPTEILAQQHASLFQRWFARLGLEVVLCTSSHPVRLAESHGAVPRLTIGTHALIEEKTVLDRLGLVVIDEQHRFGVAQREALLRKGDCPHLLVMTATPIPRTLALSMFGDLDVSILRGRPPGRGRIRTFSRRCEELEKVWNFVKTRLAAGERAYVIYPLIENSEETEAASVTQHAVELAEHVSPFRVGVMHGRLRPDDKLSVMAQFTGGIVQVLASTSVVEVGVDVPEATVMVIMDADRFGLAQLHQMRGRVGRGRRDSYCVLASASEDPEVLKRLQVLVESSDGFHLAEADLKLRGAGEFLGRAQSGVPPFKFAQLETDWELAQRARELVAAHSLKPASGLQACPTKAGGAPPA